MFGVAAEVGLLEDLGGLGGCVYDGLASAAEDCGCKRGDLCGL